MYIVLYNSFISQYQKYTVRISPALSSRDQWHVTVTANDKMTRIPAMHPYIPAAGMLSTMIIIIIIVKFIWHHTIPADSEV